MMTMMMAWMKIRAIGMDGESHDDRLGHDFRFKFMS